MVEYLSGLVKNCPARPLVGEVPNSYTLEVFIIERHSGGEAVA
jgi:hypothetical protein